MGIRIEHVSELFLASAFARRSGRLRRLLRLSLAGFFVFGAIPFVKAQTVVQLPTVQNFGMSTSVLVPDRGRTYAGGVNRSYRSSTRRGTPFFPPSSRGYGGGTTANGVSVSAYIHDFEEMDRTLLEQAARNRGDRFGASQTSATFSTKVADRPELDHRLPRVSDVRRQMAAVRAEKYAQMKSQITVGLRREKSGDLAGAQAKYRVAMKYATPDHRKKIEARIEKLDALLASRSATTSTKR